MAIRKRRTTRRTASRTTKKKVRRKKGVSKAGITPAQKKKLNKALKDVEKHITNLTRKYNQMVKSFKNW